MSERFSCAPLICSTKSRTPQKRIERLKGVPSILGVKPPHPSPLSKERRRRGDRTISIYQRSVPAHPMKRLGRADPTICIAGCSKGGNGKCLVCTKVGEGKPKSEPTCRNVRQVTAISKSVKKAIRDCSCHSCLYSASCLGKQFRALRLLHAIASSLF